MSEIVELVRTSTDTGWVFFCALCVGALGLLVLDRGPRASTVEEAPESHERHAA